MAIFEMYTNYDGIDFFENHDLSCEEYAEPVENAIEKEASILQSLENLNVGEDQTLIESLVSITADELQ